MSEIPPETTIKVSRLRKSDVNSQSYLAILKTESGNRKVRIKEVREDSYMFENYKGALEEKVIKMKTVFGVIREYLGDVVVDTDFRLGENAEGKRCILLIQDEIEGKGMYEGDPEYTKFSQTEKHQLQEKLDNALGDPIITATEGIEDAVNWIRADALGTPKNVMLTPERQYRLVDVV